MDREGRLWLLGRAKDVIKSGGENVFAPEVEEALCRHPIVMAAAGVGLVDERLGEKVWGEDVQGSDDGYYRNSSTVLRLRLLLFSTKERDGAGWISEFWGITLIGGLTQPRGGGAARQMNLVPGIQQATLV
jgi:hypothetical protein